MRYSTILMSHGVSRIENLAREELGSLMTALRGLSSGLEGSSKPKSIGYPWEGTQFMPDNLPIKLIDALGRKVLIPMELCGSWKVNSNEGMIDKSHTLPQDFNFVISRLFKGCPGEGFVSRRHFEISVTNDKRRKLDPWLWSETVKAGLTVVMTIVFERESQSFDSRDCPRCGATSGCQSIEESLEW